MPTYCDRKARTRPIQDEIGNRLPSRPCCPAAVLRPGHPGRSGQTLTLQTQLAIIFIFK